MIKFTDENFKPPPEVPLRKLNSLTIGWYRVCMGNNPSDGLAMMFVGDTFAFLLYDDGTRRIYINQSFKDFHVYDPRAIDITEIKYKLK